MPITKKKNGRPEKEIDKKQFESLCAIQCTYEEVCAVLDVTDKTLNSWCKQEYDKTFSEVFAEKRKIGHASLRRRQWQMSEKVPSMAIWLGKQYLGQHEPIIKEAEEVEVEDTTKTESDIYGS